MKLREDEFNRGNPLRGVNPRRDAATVVFHGNRGVCVPSKRNFRTEPRENFIARVINHFLDNVQGIVREGVHPRTLPHGFQPL